MLICKICENFMVQISLYTVMILVVINNVIRCGHYSRVATIKVWPLFKGGYYKGVATIQGWLQLKMWNLASTLHILCNMNQFVDYILIKNVSILAIHCQP